MDIQLGSDCSGDHLINVLATHVINGFVSGLSARVPPGTKILDLGCGDAWFLSGFADRLPDSALGSNWSQRLQLIGLDINEESIRLASQRESRATFSIADVTENIPVEDNSVCTAFMMQVDTVLDRAACLRVLQGVRPKLMMGAYLGFIHVHPEQASVIAHATGAPLGTSESRYVTVSDEGKWIHGEAVFPEVMGEVGLTQVGEMNFVTDFPRMRYTLLQKRY